MQYPRRPKVWIYYHVMHVYALHAYYRYTVYAIHAYYRYTTCGLHM